MPSVMGRKTNKNSALRRGFRGAVLSGACVHRLADRGGLRRSSILPASLIAGRRELIPDSATGAGVWHALPHGRVSVPRVHRVRDVAAGRVALTASHHDLSRQGIPTRSDIARLTRRCDRRRGPTRGLLVRSSVLADGRWLRHGAAVVASRGVFRGQRHLSFRRGAARCPRGCRSALASVFRA